MKIKKFPYGLMLLASLCLGLTVAWSDIPFDVALLRSTDPCAAADFLLAQGELEDAHQLYLKLLEDSLSRECAQAGLIRLSEAKRQAAAEEEARLESLPRPLVDTLSVTGVQRCPSLLGRWLRCGTRWIGWPALVLPLANTDPTNLTPLVAPPTLLINSENGQTLPARLGKYEQRGDRIAIPIEASGLDSANGRFTGSFDLLPEDKERGTFSLELKLRDAVIWALLTVLIGVYLSTLIRIYINKFLPAQALDRQLQELRQQIQAKGFTPPGTGQEFAKRLKHYSIVKDSLERLGLLARDLKEALSNVENDNLRASSTDPSISSLYTRFAAEQTLLTELQNLPNDYLLPAHQAFLKAWNEAQNLHPAPLRIRLLELAEDALYTPTPEKDPQTIASAADLQALKAGLTGWCERLNKLAAVLFRLRLCQSLAQQILPSHAGLPPDFKLQFFQALGKMQARSELLALEIQSNELQTIAQDLDTALSSLKTIWAFLNPGRGEALPPPASLPQAAAIEFLQPKAPAEVKITPLRLTAEYFLYWPNALSLVLAVAFALSTLYFGKTFGSPADYLAALAWGLGVDTATRTIPGLLSGLGIGKT